MLHETRGPGNVPEACGGRAIISDLSCCHDRAALNGLGAMPFAAFVLGLKDAAVFFIDDRNQVLGRLWYPGCAASCRATRFPLRNPTVAYTGGVSRTQRAFQSCRRARTRSSVDSKLVMLAWARAQEPRTPRAS